MRSARQSIQFTREKQYPHLSTLPWVLTQSPGIAPQTVGRSSPRPRGKRSRHGSRSPQFTRLSTFRFLLNLSLFSFEAVCVESARVLCAVVRHLLLAFCLLPKLSERVVFTFFSRRQSPKEYAAVDQFEGSCFFKASSSAPNEREFLQHTESSHRLL